MCFCKDRNILLVYPNKYQVKITLLIVIEIVIILLLGTKIIINNLAR